MGSGNFIGAIVTFKVIGKEFPAFKFEQGAIEAYSSTPILLDGAGKGYSPTFFGND